jgi:uncharacterized sulfatase
MRRWIVVGLVLVVAGAAVAAERPNILWISTEDIGPHLGCYGDPHAYTPTLDALAAGGIRYTHAFTAAPVCAPNRSSIITGMYATTLGTQHMRSGGEGTERSILPQLPDPIRCFSGYLRDAGYYCTNNSKEDYNFVRRKDAWDGSSKNAHWKNRPDPDQPFFAVFNYQGTHEGSVRLTPEQHAKRTENIPDAARQNPDDITPPPYHPNTPAVRQNWANYHELITVFDMWVADRLRELEEAGAADNTIVIFWSDHGAGLPRNKRWPYDSGVHVPVIVHVPEALRGDGIPDPGTVTDRIISSIDFAPTTLRFAGLDVPDYMQGRVFLGPDADAPRQHAFSARDRMDERYDIIRTVRDAQYRYTRNYEPWKPYDQFMNSAEKSVIKEELHRLAKAGELSDAAQWVTKTSKPVEELYDAAADPHMVHNLADDPAHVNKLTELRAVHEQWMIDTRDVGLIPEPELVALEERFGSRYAILPGLEEQYPGFAERLRAFAGMAGAPKVEEVRELAKHLEHPEATVRYWACVGVGNWLALADRGWELTTDGAQVFARNYAGAVGQYADGMLSALAQRLKDEAGVVRVAAARVLLLSDHMPEEALGALVAALESDREWVRLHAALALDAAEDAARPAIPQLKGALNDTENKYVVRVANRALNQMLGTDNEVR